MKILITRPSEQGMQFSLEISKRNLTPIISPLIEIIPNKAELSEHIKSTKKYIITSSNAIHAILSLDKDSKIYTICGTTYEMIRDLGFFNVICFGDNVESLKQNISYDEDIIYLSGDQVSYDFSDFPMIRREIVYYSELVKTPNQAFFDFFSCDELKIITLFSLRTAKNLIYLIKKNNLQDKCHNITLLCLSKKIAIAQEKEDIRFKASYYPIRPNILELLELLEKITDHEKR